MRQPTFGRRATRAERYEHARWSMRGAEDIDALYREWPLYERLAIMMYCM